MPFIRARHELIDHTVNGDVEIFTHIEDNLPAKYEAMMSRKEFDKSFKIGRDAWPVACVPHLLFKKFVHNGTVDWKQFDKWLKSEEGRSYRAS